MSPDVPLPWFPPPVSHFPPPNPLRILHVSLIPATDLILPRGCVKNVQSVPIIPEGLPVSLCHVLIVSLKHRGTED